MFDGSGVTSPQLSMTLRGSDMQPGWAACRWADWNCRVMCCSSNHQDVRLYCLPLSVWLTEPSQAAAAPAATAAAANATVGSVAPGARRMVAIFDYDPRESSPNNDIEVRLAHTYIFSLETKCSSSLCSLSAPFFYDRLSWPSAQETSYMCLVTWMKMASSM